MRADRTEAGVVASPEAPKPNSTEPPTEKSAELAQLRPSSPAMADISTKQAYRPEIEGLRAIAAILVAVYHIWLGRISGGVDVFFVVSGYLITTSLCRQVKEGGAIRVWEFWGRLVKRLVPNAYLVITATLLGSLFFVPQTQWEQTIEQAAASATNVENWWLALNGVDYLAREIPPAPFLHFWALSTQGQFYLLWPFFFWFALKLGRGRGRSDRWSLVAGFAAIFVLSLPYSIITTQAHQAFAYVDPAARLWEFSLGGLLALLHSTVRLPSRIAHLVGWAGLIGIVSCGVVLNVGEAFPGYAALWPTLCAVAVLIAAQTPRRFGVERFLGLRPLVAFGGISYAFYLWHWPLLIFTLNYNVNELGVTPSQGIAIIGASAVLAWLSTRFIEKPLRGCSLWRGSSIWGAAGLVAVCGLPLLIVLSVWSAHVIGEKERGRAVALLGHPDYPGATVGAVSDQTIARDGVRVLPGSFTVLNDLPIQYLDGCHQEEESVEPVHCVYGDPEGRAAVAVIGGSHAVQWMPVLDIIGKANGIKVLSITKRGCMYLPESDLPGERYPQCLVWRRRVLDLLPTLGINAVFTTGTRWRGPEERVPSMYIDVWRRLEKAGIGVIAVRDNPRSNLRRIHACIDLFGPKSPKCQTPRREALGALDDILDQVELPSNVRFLDLSDRFCDQDTCYPVVGNIMVYRDMSHLTASFVRSFAPILQDRFVKLVREP